MALKLMSLLLIWGLTLFVAAASSCNVTCFTDYEESLNCSCSDSGLLHPVLVNVTCREEDDEVHGRCVIEPTQSWCLVRPKGFKILLSVGTICTSTASLQNSQVTMDRDWQLCNRVKPRPPSNVTLVNTGNSYNITWRKSSALWLEYQLRIRTENSLQAPRILEVDKEFCIIDHDQLKPHKKLTVDVQAKVCKNFLEGPWSEWSPSAEWRDARVEGMDIFWVYVSLPIILVLGLLLLGYLQKPSLLTLRHYSRKSRFLLSAFLVMIEDAAAFGHIFASARLVFWQKKLEMISYYPKPNGFFEPLYANHGGNFEEWVKPLFKEYDYLKMDGSVPLQSEKHHSVVQWHEKESYHKESEMEEGHLHVSQPTNNLLLNFQGSGSSQGTGHSTGHISIHTVTLSREDFEEEVTSQSSLRSYQDGESFGSFEDGNREHAGYDFEELRGSRIGLSLQHENQIANEGQIDEPERVSLHSFASNEQSEDGYPHVDLDTIDSGFGECGSPGASDSNRVDHINSFHEHKNSNYVKQWMICSTIQEDTNNVREELHET